MKLKGEGRMDDDIEVRRAEARAKINEEMIKHAKTYQSIVFGMAYAGFFGLWFGVREMVNSGAVLLSGLSMIISLSIYVLWEVYATQMLMDAQLSAVYQLDNERDLSHQDFVDLRSKIARTQARIFKYQPIVFYCSLGAGLVGISVMTFGFIHEFYHL